MTAKEPTATISPSPNAAAAMICTTRARPSGYASQKLAHSHAGTKLSGIPPKVCVLRRSYSHALFSRCHLPSRRDQAGSPRLRVRLLYPQVIAVDCTGRSWTLLTERTKRRTSVKRTDRQTDRLTPRRSEGRTGRLTGAHTHTSRAGTPSWTHCHASTCLMLQRLKRCRTRAEKQRRWCKSPLT